MFEENWGRILKGRCYGCQNTLCGCQNLPLIDLLESFVKELIACQYDKRKEKVFCQILTEYSRNYKVLEN